MSSELNNAIEQAIPGLKIDGVVTTADAIAVGTKVLEVTAIVAGTIKPDGKIDTADVTSVVNAAASLAPASFKKAVLDYFESEVKASKSKIDDAIALPIIGILRRIFGVK